MDRLHQHLVHWLGEWPPRAALTVVGSPARERPGWDGAVRPVLAVADRAGRAVLSVPPALAPTLRASQLREALDVLPGMLGAADSYEAVFRWTTAPARLPDAGVWVAADGDGVPEWLRPFGGEVLLVRDEDGAVVAGLGLKRHDAVGREIAVGTEPVVRGRGLARRLVAQAARRVLDEGGVPTYQHSPDNTASARVAEAAGFTDRGWRSYGLVPVPVPAAG